MNNRVENMTTVPALYGVGEGRGASESKDKHIPENTKEKKSQRQLSRKRMEGK